MLASGAILAAGALVLSSLLGQSFREQVLEDTAREGALFSDSVLTPLVRGNRIVVSAAARRKLARAVRETEFTSVAVWTRSGRAARLDSRRTGAREHPAPRLRGRARSAARTSDAHRPSRPVAERLSSGARARGLVADPLEQRPPRRGRAGPARPARSRRERRRDHPDDLDRGRRRLRHPLARARSSSSAAPPRGSRARTTPSRSARASSPSRRRRVEENLLETIETLNAAVEARDPYTAGHSQRVRRVALAIGRELALPAPAARRARHGRALPRRRQDRDPGLDPHQDRAARAAERPRSCAST